MITVNQIRINNLIYNDIGEIQPVYGVDEKSILTKVEENVWSICFNPKGIPLTEELLLKFGFEIEIGYSHNIAKLGFIRIKFGDNFYFDYTYSRTKIQYVHQLQNLHFALTGEELTLKN